MSKTTRMVKVDSRQTKGSQMRILGRTDRGERVDLTLALGRAFTQNGNQVDLNGVAIEQLHIAERLIVTLDVTGEVLEIVAADAQSMKGVE